MKNLGFGYEVTAINTDGKWYAYASYNNKTAYTGTFGYTRREDAIFEAENFVRMKTNGGIKN